jgi:outer membrane protein assembly factor BamD
LEMPAQAQEMLDILKLNYPDYPAINADGSFNDRYMYNDGKFNWAAWLTFGLFSKVEITGFDTRHIYDPEYKEPDSTEAPKPNS